MSNKKVEKGFTMHFRPVQRLKYLPVKETGERKPFNPVQKAIYFFLYAFIKNGRKAYPSLEEIADEVGVSRATVHRAIDELVSFGIVRRQYQGKNKSVLYHMASPKIVMEIGKTIPENDVWLNKKREAVDYEIDWEEAVEAAEAFKASRVDSEFKAAQKNYKPGEEPVQPALQDEQEKEEAYVPQEEAPLASSEASGEEKEAQANVSHSFSVEPVTEAPMGLDAFTNEEEFVDDFEYDAPPLVDSQYVPDAPPSVDVTEEDYEDVLSSVLKTEEPPEEEDAGRAAFKQRIEEENAISEEMRARLRASLERMNAKQKADKPAYNN